MVTAQTPAIVERGVNLIYQHGWTNKKWYQSSDGTYSPCVGYESSQWRVEKYKVTIPEIKYGDKVENALSLQVTFTGTSGSKYKFGHGDETIRTYDYWITELDLPNYGDLKEPLLMGADTDRGRHGKFSFTNETYPSANFTIKFDEGASLAPGTYYLFIYRDTNRFHWRHWNDHLAPQILVETRGYSECSPVTSAIIQDKPTYFSTIKEGTSFTLEWDGAEGGINNDIAGYKLEYSYDNKQNWRVLNEKVVGTSYEVKGSEWKDHQGKTFYFRITTLGEATTSNDNNWDSIPVEFSTSIKANKPPVIKSLTAPYTIYWPNKPDATDSDKYLNLSCVYINDEFDQTIEYQIGESTSYLSSLKIDLSNELAGEKTFVIRLYDGYDKSEPGQIKIQIIKTESNKSYGLNLKNGMKYTWNLSIGEQTSTYDNPETVTISIDMEGKNKNKSFALGDTFKIADVLSDTLIDSAKNYNITAIIYKNYRGVFHEIGRATGVGTIEAPQAIEEATFKDEINQYVIDPFYSNLAISIKNYDSSARYSLVAINANGIIASDIVSIQDINESALTATINQTKFNDRDYCTLHFQKIVEDLTISSVFSVRFGYRPNLVGASINWGAYVCKPFEIGLNQEESSKEVGIRNPFGVSTGYDELYYIKEIQLVIEDGLERISPINKETRGDILSLVFDEKELARLGFVHTKTGRFGGNFNLSCFLEITNTYGESYRSETSQLAFDFDTQVETIEITEFKITDPDSSSIMLLHLQEGAKLILDCQIKPYAAKDLELRLYKKISQSGNWELFSSQIIEYDRSKEDWYGGYSYENKTLTVSSGEIKHTWEVGSIPELTSNLYDWKLEIDRKSFEVQKTAIAHSNPVVLINEGSLNKNNAELVVSLNENLAGTKDLEGVVIVRNNTLEVSGLNETFNENNNSSFIYEREDTTKPVPAFLQVKIKYKTTVRQGNYSVAHVSESNSIYIYSSAPTVSYRENCVGINTSAPDFVNDHPSGAVLMISPAPDKNKIYIVGNKSTAQIDLGDSINLINFIIDGGSW